MPNWCSNWISTDNQDVIEVFKKLEKRQKESGFGETLDWFGDDRYLFEINTHDSGVSFETKWSPAFKTAEAIAKVLNTRIELNYDEPGMAIYGKTFFYPDGQVVNYQLQGSDFDRIDWDEDSGLFTFEGEEYESDSEIKEILLEDLIDSRNLTNEN